MSNLDRREGDGWDDVLSGCGARMGIQAVKEEAAAWEDIGPHSG